MCLGAGGCEKERERRWFQGKLADFVKKREKRRDALAKKQASVQRKWDSPQLTACESGRRLSEVGEKNNHIFFSMLS
jgi:hypothetical protein